jgi:hypothetical protein
MAWTVFRADDGGRSLQVDARQFGGVGEERFRCQVDARGDRAAQVFAILGQCVEGGRRTEINDTGRTTIQVHDGHRVGDAVCANRLWILVPDFDTGLDPHIHDKRVHFQIFPAGLHDTRPVSCGTTDATGRCPLILIV